MKRTTERGKTLLRRSVLSLTVFLLFLSVAALAFVKINNSDERIMAIYKYQRLANGTLKQIEEKDFIKQKHKKRFRIKKN